MKNKVFLLSLMGLILHGCNVMNSPIIYRSDLYTIYSDRVVQGPYVAKANTPTEIVSNYVSPVNEFKSPVVTFKFSINGADNSIASGKDNTFICMGGKTNYITPVIKFGQQYTDTSRFLQNDYLQQDVNITIRADMNEVLHSFREHGYFVCFDGSKIRKSDFKGVFVAGNISPLTWDFNNLHAHEELKMEDEDQDGIYEITLTLNQQPEAGQTASAWKLKNDISAFPRYHSPDVLADALYNMALDEMQNAIEPDSTFRTGKEWAGVWTRDISYSILLSMAILQPRVAMISLKKKVKDGQIIQDTGTGGSYPVSTDREIWAMAAWEVYKVTGDMDWLSYAYQIIKNSIDRDIENIYDTETGMVKGESSFLDWREQTYPGWMQPADIYESECLGTNAVHFAANKVLSKMAHLLNFKEDAIKYSAVAHQIQQGVNQYLWLEDKGYYGQYLYGGNYKILSPRTDALGEALAVIFGIADKEKQQRIISNSPVTPYGITCIYPQIPGIPPYHNNAVWPFVSSFRALASAKAENEAAAVAAISSVYRAAALFVTNKENFVAGNGGYAGTQINSSNMLWSLSGSISLVYKVLFGMHFNEDNLTFKPFVPKVFNGKRVLEHFRYRNAILDIEMEGFGNTIKTFLVDGKENPEYLIPASMRGKHTVTIILSNEDMGSNEMNAVTNAFSPEMPKVDYTKGVLYWTATNENVIYKILKNGKPIKVTKEPQYKVASNAYGTYQVIAIGESNLVSFASEPIQIYPESHEQIFQLESYAIKSSRDISGFTGSGFVEITKNHNKLIELSIDIPASGTYSLQVRYANGNGPVNTDNKCAFRNLAVDRDKAGTIVFPQRGKDAWSNWGWSNPIKLQLSKGRHSIALCFENFNENMNGKVNQAMLDCLRVLRL